jgi:hypothetical protein
MESRHPVEGEARKLTFVVIFMLVLVLVLFGLAPPV